MPSSTLAVQPCVDWDYCADCGGVGQDANACLWCGTCKGTGSIPRGRSHYEVVSPVMTDYHQGMAEPESGRCWGVYFVHNKAEARSAAVKDPQFKEWVQVARGDGVPPFKGLEVSLFRCPHGLCFDCADVFAIEDPDDVAPGCPACEAEGGDHDPAD